MFCFTNSILVPVRVNLLLWTRKAILRSAQLSWLVDWFPEGVAGLYLWGAMCQSKLPRKPSRLIQVCRNVVNNDEVEVWSFEFNWVGRTRSGFVQNFIFAFCSIFRSGKKTETFDFNVQFYGFWSKKRNRQSRPVSLWVVVCTGHVGNISTAPYNRKNEPVLPNKLWARFTV